MMDNKKGGFFYTLFRGINTLRLIIINILFFTLLFMFISAINKYGKDSPAKQTVPAADSVLMITPSGRLTEKSSSILWSDYLLENSYKEVLLTDITDALKHAAYDRRITSVFMDLSGLYGVSSGCFSELKAALNEYKKSGKPLAVFSDSYRIGTYYIASFADSIYLDPLGEVNLTGFYTESLFYGGMEEKLGIRWNVIQAGAYKGMAETYSRTGMSENVKQNYRLVFQNLWETYTTEIAANRNIPKEALVAFVDNYTGALQQSNGSAAEAALAAQLITHTASYDETGAALGLCDEMYYPVSGRLISYLDYNKSFSKTERSNKIGLIYIDGAITSTAANKTGQAVSSDLQDLFNEAASDDSVKAVVVRIDSGGGEVFASEEIRRNVEWLSKKIGKKVIVSMGSVAASGAYWIASSADYIFSSPYTITGSIGVLAVMPVVQTMLKDYFGIYSDGIGATANRPYSLFKELSTSEREQAELEIAHTYRVFLETVSKGRNIPVETLEELAQGKVYTGIQARDIQLVDEIGGLSEAFVYAAASCGIAEKYSVKIIQPELPFKEEILKNLLTKDARIHTLGDLLMLYDFTRLRSKKGYYVYTPIRPLFED